METYGNHLGTSTQPAPGHGTPGKWMFNGLLCISFFLICYPRTSPFRIVLRQMSRALAPSRTPLRTLQPLYWPLRVRLILPLHLLQGLQSKIRRLQETSVSRPLPQFRRCDGTVTRCDDAACCAGANGRKRGEHLSGRHDPKTFQDMFRMGLKWPSNQMAVRKETHYLVDNSTRLVSIYLPSDILKDTANGL